MADTDKTVAYGITADASPFEKGMRDAADSAKGMASSIDSNFKKVGDAFASVQKQLLILAGLVAGGAFFKDAISASNQLTGETMKLSKMLGITGEEAATLRTALDDIGSNGDDYVATFTKFARQLKSNEEGLQSLGLKTRDANGNLRDSNTLFNEALQSVGKYKAGLDQNTYAQTLFGKSIDDVMKFQKLNNGVLEEARKKNEELGLTISEDNVAASKAYKMAMNDVGDVLTAVKKTIGDAVMPVFTELAEYFASTGPYVVQVFKGAMMGLLAAFEVVKGAVKTVAGVIFEAFSLIVDGAGLIGDVFAKLFKGDFSGAYESAKEVGKRVGQAFSGAFQNFLDSGNETEAAVKRHMERLYGDKAAMGGPKSGTKTMGDFGKSNGTTKETPRTGQWEAELAEQKLAFQEKMNLEGSFAQFGKQAELDFWQTKLALTKAGTAENIAVRRKLADLQLGMGQEAYNHELAALVAQEAAYKTNTQAKLEILDQEATLVKQRYGAESKEYEEVQKKIIATKRLAAEQLQQIDMVRADATRSAALAQIQIEEQQAQLEFDLHQTNAEELLAKQREFEERRYAIQMQAQAERLAIAAQDPDLNVVLIAQLNAQKEQLEQQHQAKLAEIRGQATRQQQQTMMSIYSSMESGFASVISKTMQGSQTLMGTLRGLWQAVVQSVSNALGQIAAKWLMENVVRKVMGKATALGEINANAGVAGSAAVASTAAIPIVGPAMAPAAGAAASAAAMSFSSLVAAPGFAVGSWDVPSDMITKIHKGEMIMPAEFADRFRDGESQKGSDVNVSIKAHPMPGNYFMVHRDQLVQAIKSAKRDFAY